MIRTIARRSSLTVAMAGAVAFGAVALAPAASAATADVDGGYSIVEKTNGNGPVAFLVSELGTTPIFYCDADKPKKRHNNCQDDPEASDSRF
jgi:hypothetical protein